MRLSKLIHYAVLATILGAGLSGAPVKLPLAREELVTAVAADLAAHFRLEGDLQLELLRAWSPPAELAERWTVTVEEYPPVATSSMIVRCRVQGDAAPAADYVLIVKVALWRDAWATRQPLTVGAVFDPALLEVRRVDALRERDALPASAGDRTAVFARAVQAGRVLTWRDIARRPLVRKGEIVEVSATDGSLAIGLKALAMESGSKGDTITLRNPVSRKDFPGLVTDDKRVEVRF